MIKDAQGLSFLAQQSRVLSSRAFDVEYDIVNYAELVPVNTEYPEWSAGVDFQIGDLAGAAKWQSGWAEDVPKADVSLISVGSNFAMYAVGYGYNVEELGRAMHAGYPLTARKAVAARQAADIFCAETAINGGGHPGWTGLINQNITATASPNNGTGSARTWVNNSGVATKTPIQIVTDINNILIGNTAATGIMTSLIANTLLLPPLAYKHIATTPFGTDAPAMTILQWVMANNVYTTRTGQPLIVREQPFLATAGTGSYSGQGRAIAYRNAPDALELPMPMPFNFLEVQQHGPLQWQVPGIGRVGELVILRDGAIKYLDGITPTPA